MKAFYAKPLSGALRKPPISCFARPGYLRVDLEVWKIFAHECNSVWLVFLRTACYHSYGFLRFDVSFVTVNHST